jgi:hypothetical protein
MFSTLKNFFLKSWNYFFPSNNSKMPDTKLCESPTSPIIASSNHPQDNSEITPTPTPTLTPTLISTKCVLCKMNIEKPNIHIVYNFPYCTGCFLTEVSSPYL